MGASSAAFITVNHMRLKLALAKILSFLILLSVCGCHFFSQPTFYLGGIQVNEPDHEHWVESLKAAQMNTVAVTVYAHQGDWNSANLWFDKSNQSVIDEIRTAKKHSLQVVLIMRVALDHAFEENKFLWHGMIQPKDDATRAEWFRRYQNFVLHWAEVAEEEGVDVFGIGSEMNSLSATSRVTELPPLLDYYLDREKQESLRKKLLRGASDLESAHHLIPGGKNFATLEEYFIAKQAAEEVWASAVSYKDAENPLERINQRREKLEQHWFELIEKVRQKYSGKLTYAANFDQFQTVSFWHKLDIMGINAYFPLRKEYLKPEHKNILESLLEDSWSDILLQIAELRQKRSLKNMPVVFTELGYTHRENSTLEPWAMNGFSLVKHGEETERIIWHEQGRDFSERTLALRALQRAHSKLKEPLLKGILYWKLSTIESHLQIEPFVHILGYEEDKEFAETLRAFL